MEAIDKVIKALIKSRMLSGRGTSFITERAADIALIRDLDITVLSKGRDEFIFFGLTDLGAVFQDDYIIIAVLVGS